MKELTIFSFDTIYQISEYDKIVMKELKNKFPGESIHEAKGSWNGITERSWVVSEDAYNNLDPSYMKEQTCVLKVPTDGKNLAYLLYPNKTREIIGRLTELTWEQAKGQNFTLLNGKFYGVLS